MHAVASDWRRLLSRAWVGIGLGLGLGLGFGFGLRWGKLVSRA
jgi:hypothetical protein